LSDEDKARLAAARIAEEQKKSRGWYRVNASRKLFGGKSLAPRLNPQLSEVDLCLHSAPTNRFLYYLYF